MGETDLLAQALTLGIHVRYRPLAPGLCGCYLDTGRLIVIDDALSAPQRRCTLAHELAHARHGDHGCRGVGGGKAERRARRETALQLIDPRAYASAEIVYEGDVWWIAAELDVTVQVVEDYRLLLHDGGTVLGGVW
ncbi:hypothetical protein D2E24_1660 [Bifidobacterium samirii]|uniref:IrrE N-terminal-like domain-containing protein n=2 Tax=Bifidobacterium samirii TaxID=2306974 RepID=A0A430FJD4_9BIFI|nr:ImmA/IrrE family metallo-endopeptidase [Bifidobacterium samirii]RSX52989.1 hypothetical protein D2E24_1660 [Bifidobacterium samirii]